MMKKMFLGLVFVLAVTAPVVAAASVVIDVRTPDEWRSGHVEGSVLIPHDRIAEDIGKVVPAKDTRIYLYCRSGRRTGIAAEAVKKAGYTNVVDLKTLQDAARELKRPIVQ